MSKKIVSLEQFKEINGKLKKSIVIVKARNGDEIEFDIKELSPSQLIDYQTEVQKLNVVDGVLKATKTEQFVSAIRLVSYSIIGQNNKQIFNNDDARNYLKDNFNLKQMTKVINAVLILSGLTEEEKEKIKKK